MLFNTRTREQADITVAVYGGMEKAEDQALKCLARINDTLQPGCPAGRVLGTHSWYLIDADGDSLLILVYLNALVQISASEKSTMLRIAGDLAEDLAAGKNGMRLGKSVLVPSAREVKLTWGEKLELGRRVVYPTQVREDENVKYSVIPSRGQLVPDRKRGTAFYVPAGKGAVTFTVYAINDRNVVSEPFRYQQE